MFHRQLEAHGTIACTPQPDHVRVRSAYAAREREFNHFATVRKWLSGGRPPPIVAQPLPVRVPWATQARV